MTSEFSFSQFTLSDRELRAMLPELAEPVWQAIAKFRHFNHSGGNCTRRAARIVAHVERGVDVGTCSPACVDLFTVTFAHVAHALARQAGPVRNVGGFVARTAERFAQDVLRRERVARGDVAKPMRTDGVNGVIIAALPPDIEPQFLGWMLTDASRNGPVPAEGWNFDYLAEKLCSVRAGLDSSQALRLVREYVPTVLRIVGEVAPEGWDVDKFEVPRARRRALHQSIPVISAAGHDEIGLELCDGGTGATGAAVEAMAAMGDALRHVFRRSLLELGPLKAMQAACLALEPELDLARLDTAVLLSVAVDFVVEMALGTAATGGGQRRLAELPSLPDLRHVIVNCCDAATGGAAVTDAFLARVQKLLVAFVESPGPR